MCEEAVIDSLVMFLWLFHDDIWSILTRLCVTTHRRLLLRGLWKQSVFWKIPRIDVKCTTLPSCFFTFIILNVPSKPFIVSGRLNHSGYLLSLCDNPQPLLSGCSFLHCRSRLLTLLPPRWAFVCDQPWPSNLVNFNTLDFLTEPHVMKFVTQLLPLSQQLHRRNPHLSDLIFRYAPLLTTKDLAPVKIKLCSAALLLT